MEELGIAGENPLVMSTYVPYMPDQAFLLPPDMRDWLPEGHLALCVSDVVDTLDLSGIHQVYENDGRGRPAYHPRMMVKLLTYGYCVGVWSSRKIEKATWTDVAFRVLAANQHPDHDTIATFRRRHLKEFRKLFLQVLRICQDTGLVKLGRVVLDGTKVKANASKHKAMSYDRMLKKEKELQAEIDKLLRQAEKADAVEDARLGKGKREEDLPEELKRRESRLRKIQEAKARLEAEAKAKARREAEKREAKRGPKGGGSGGESPPPDPDEAVPGPKAQKNFTDPDSRMMWNSSTKSFEQAYNAQVVVDEESQVIIASSVTQEGNDKAQLLPMLKLAAENIGHMPGVILADAGYFSGQAVTDKIFSHSELYISPDRWKHGQEPPLSMGPPPPEASVVERMRHKLRTPEGREIYKRRKIIEPVFGQIKEARGFRRFSLRGLDRVAAEWDLICLAHNITKLFRSGWSPALGQA